MADLPSATAATENMEMKTLRDNPSVWLHTGCTDRTELSADLIRLADAWPKLPEHIRRAILTMADGYR
jgi:hypothetical protein